MNSPVDLSSLVLYRSLLQDQTIKKLLYTLENPNQPEAAADLAGDLIHKAERIGLKGNLLKEYLLYLITRDTNIFCLACEKQGPQVQDTLLYAAIHDMEIILQFLHTNFSRYLDTQFIDDYIPTTTSLPMLYCLSFAANSPQELAEKLSRHYSLNGCGKLAGLAAFRWDNEAGLTGIENFDPIRLEDLIGYERQKEELVKNTEAFLSGKPANHVLLSGTRGTGKSSSVKALVNNYFSRGLRLVEVTKQDLKHLSKIMDILRPRGKKFIIFLDDLSFEEFEVEYKYLKSVIEGGVEARPDNVLIYATSNRRHLIKESWSDRSDNPDEIHRFDTINEKISLSDRFGITLSYVAPTQEEYLKIIEELAKKQSIPLSPEELKAKAIHWEMAHSGRSGRSARQLIDYLLGE